MAEKHGAADGSRAWDRTIPSFCVRQALRVLEGTFYFNSQAPLKGGKYDTEGGDGHLWGCGSACDL